MSATTESTETRASYYEEPTKDAEELSDTAVLPTGEIVEDGQRFEWHRTTHEIRITGEQIRFIRDPDAPTGYPMSGPEMVVWVQPDSEEEFHEFLAEHGDEIVFHERPSQQTGLLDALRDALPL